MNKLNWGGALPSAVGQSPGPGKPGVPHFPASASEKGSGDSWLQGVPVSPPTAKINPSREPGVKIQDRKAAHSTGKLLFNHSFENRYFQSKPKQQKHESLLGKYLRAKVPLSVVTSMVSEAGRKGGRTLLCTAGLGPRALPAPVATQLGLK